MNIYVSTRSELYPRDWRLVLGLGFEPMWRSGRDGRFGSKVGQIGPKWGAKCTEI